MLDIVNVKNVISTRNLKLKIKKKVRCCKVKLLFLKFLISNDYHISCKSLKQFKKNENNDILKKKSFTAFLVYAFHKKNISYFTLCSHKFFFATLKVKTKQTALGEQKLSWETLNFFKSSWVFLNLKKGYILLFKKGKNKVFKMIGYKSTKNLN